MYKFMTLDDNHTPIFLPVINPISSSVCLVQWRLTLDAVKMRGIKVPRMSQNLKITTLYSSYKDVRSSKQGF